MVRCPSPNISALVATRNRAHLLERVLISLLDEQMLEGLSGEHIVIDYVSVGDTQAVLKRAWNGACMKLL